MFYNTSFAGSWATKKSLKIPEILSPRDTNVKFSTHSDYFVWKDTSESVTRPWRWEYTSWQEASEFLCIKTLPFLRKFSNKKKSPQTPGNAFSEALLKSRFQNFAAGAALKKTQPRFVYSGPKILWSCLLHSPWSPGKYPQPKHIYWYIGWRIKRENERWQTPGTKFFEKTPNHRPQDTSPLDHQTSLN